MSGHSKWSTIKHQKGVADQRRGQLFSKLGRAISIAAREGADPVSNFKLRLAVEKAKQVNMPKSNIERAIVRGGGTGGEEALEEVIYEGFGPFKVAVMVEVVTDNRNRTTAEIKNLFERGGGKLTGPGSVAYQFQKMGLIRIKKPAKAEEAILKIMDLGVEEVDEAEDAIEVYVLPEKIEEVIGELGEANFSVQDKDLVMWPKMAVKISDPEKKEKLLRFMEMIEDHDDVQKTHANFDFPV